MSNKNVIDRIQNRNSSIDLLRIISMILIVFHHFAFHGGFKWQTNSVTISHFWYNFIYGGGKIGVNIFVLISGYFLIDRKTSVFSYIRRILKFWGQVFFYSFVIFFISVIVDMKNFGMQSLIKMCFPITFSSWWFASTYFVLLLIHPFLNEFLNNLKKESYQKLLILLIVCWSIIPTFINSEYQGNSFLWFVTLYAIAGYEKKYKFRIEFTSKHYFKLCFLFSLLTYLCGVIFIVIGKKWNIFATHETYLYGQEKLPILLVSLTLFLAFTRWKMNYHKWINITASATFGVYLIHDNKIVRSFLWMSLFKNYRYQDSIMIIPYSIGVVAIVYIICTMVDLVRKNLFEKSYMRIIDKYSVSWLKIFREIYNFFERKIFG